MPIIRAKRFLLRPFKKGDEFSLSENINNKKIYRNTLRIPYPYTLKDAKNWIGKNLKEIRKKKSGMVNFAIDVNGEVAGSVSLSNMYLLNEEHAAEIGYWLAEKYWGQGMMTEAAKMMTKFGFEKMKLKRIYGYVFSFNKPSKRVMEKTGFQREGFLRKNLRKDNKFIDSYLLAKLKK